MTGPDEAEDRETDRTVADVIAHLIAHDRGDLAEKLEHARDRERRLRHKAEHGQAHAERMRDWQERTVMIDTAHLRAELEAAQYALTDALAALCHDSGHEPCEMSPVALMVYRSGEAIQRSMHVAADRRALRAEQERDEAIDVAAELARALRETV